MAVGGVGLVLLLVILLSGAVFMVHRKRKLVKKLTELQEPNESSSLLNSTSTSNHTDYTSTQGISTSELLPLHNKFWLYYINLLYARLPYCFTQSCASFNVGPRCRQSSLPSPPRLKQPTIPDECKGLFLFVML